MSQDRSDIFLLAKLTKNGPAANGAQDQTYLRQNLPSSFYVSFVPINRGKISFLWVRQRNAWLIYQASIACS